MRLLIDTHLLIWAGLDGPKLSTAARKVFAIPDLQPVVSLVSLWEVTIKFRLGKPDFDVEPRRFQRELLDSNYEELPIQPDHIFALDELPMLHRDPFDRLLIAQARVEGIRLLTADERLADYGQSVWTV